VPIKKALKRLEISTPLSGKVLSQVFKFEWPQYLLFKTHSHQSNLLTMAPPIHAAIVPAKIKIKPIDPSRDNTTKIK
jgi:hypothetical protein